MTAQVPPRLTQTKETPQEVEKSDSSHEPRPYEERPRWRFWLLAAIFCCLGLVVLARLVRYQIFRTDRAFGQPPVVEEASPRGAIVDRTGVPLVVNRYFFQVAATPNQIKGQVAREEVARQLEQVIGIPYEKTLSLLTLYGDEMYTVLADAITLADAQKIRDLQAELETSEGIFPLQNVYVKPMAKRFYPQSQLTSHVVGFVQVDLGGVTGVEEYYDEYLWEDGIGLLDSQRASLNTLSPEVRRFIPSAVGKDLVLTIDRSIQWMIRDELYKGLAEFKAQSGTVIVLQPQTGAVLGMINLPDYDPNRFETMSYDLFPNPAISAQYEPGSVFKIITMAAALDAGSITPSTIFTDTGSYTLGERVIFNSNRMAHGQVTATEALARSLNVVTVQVAEQLGPTEFYQYIRLFGFGEPTGIDLSGEIEGLIKSPGHELWSLADLATNSFGQGIAATPIQMANATAVIANDGVRLRPYVVQARVFDQEVQNAEPVVARRVMHPDTANLLTEMMVDVVEMGNAKARVDGYRVAGKSGTAQIPSPEGYIQDETIVTFVGFAPTDDPQIVVLVKMDRPDPEINQWASHTAAPVFSRITKRILDYLNVPPDEIRLAQSAEGLMGSLDSSTVNRGE